MCFLLSFSILFGQQFTVFCTYGAKFEIINTICQIPVGLFRSIKKWKTKGPRELNILIILQKTNQYFSCQRSYCSNCTFIPRFCARIGWGWGQNIWMSRPVRTLTEKPGCLWAGLYRRSHPNLVRPLDWTGLDTAGPQDSHIHPPAKEVDFSWKSLHICTFKGMFIN